MSDILLEIDADLIEPHRLAGSVEDHLRNKRKRGQGGRIISPYEALKALVFEAEIVRLCAENMSFGMKLGDQDLARLRAAHRLIDSIVREATKS